MRESEQMKLGIRNQVEDISENGRHLEEPSVHDVGLVYEPSSTYRNVEVQQWVSKSKNEQMTLGIINKLNNREGSMCVTKKLFRGGHSFQRGANHLREHHLLG